MVPTQFVPLQTIRTFLLRDSTLFREPPRRTFERLIPLRRSPKSSHLCVRIFATLYPWRESNRQRTHEREMSTVPGRMVSHEFLGRRALAFHPVHPSPCLLRNLLMRA